MRNYFPLLFVLGGLLFLLSSCAAPRVTTHVTKVYDYQVPIDSVVVFELGIPIPNSAEAIGLVAVADQGTSRRCKYDQVLRLAKEATAKVGGNGLAITDHLKPSLWGSSCHQITGTMLRLTDRVVNDSIPNPVQEAIVLSYQEAVKQRAKYKAPAHTLDVSVGCGWITSKLYDPQGNEITEKSGLEWKVSYDRVFDQGFGFGLLYSGFKAKFAEIDTKITYLAPAFVGRGKFSENWIFKYALGAGLFIYDEGGFSEKVSRVGCHYELGLEYMVTEEIGIGISSSSIFASMPKQEGLKEEYTGIGRLNLLGGVRIYF